MVCQNRIKNSCSLFPQNTPSLLQKQVLLLPTLSPECDRGQARKSQLPIHEAAGRATSPEDSSENPTGVISKESQGRPVSMTEILQPCLRRCSRSAQLSFVLRRRLLHALKPESKIPGGLCWAWCHAAEQEHMALGFTTQPARTEVVENKKLSTLPHGSVTLLLSDTGLRCSGSAGANSECGASPV